LRRGGEDLEGTWSEGVGARQGDQIGFVLCEVTIPYHITVFDWICIYHRCVRSRNLPLTGYFMHTTSPYSSLLLILITSSRAIISFSRVFILLEPEPAFKRCRQRRPTVDALKLYNRGRNNHHLQAEGVILPNGALIEMIHYDNSSP